MTMTATLTAPRIEESPDLLLAEEISRFYDDPLGFVMFAYPWGEPETALEHEAGPDENQKEFLRSLGQEVQDPQLRRPYSSNADYHVRDQRPRHRQKRDGRMDCEWILRPGRIHSAL